MNIHKMVYLAGIFCRNRKIFDCYQQLKSSEAWDLNRLEANQLAKFKSLVRHAYQNSPYYREKFDNNNFHPDAINSLQDIKRLPTLSKEEVLNNAKSIQIKDVGEKQFFSETSGSTGQPLVFYRNQEWDAWHNASVLRGYSWHHVSPWERNGYLWGYNIAPEKRLKVKLLDFLQNRFRLFSYKGDEIDQFVRELRHAQYLGGYSSMVYEVAKRVNSGNSARPFHLKMIKGTSEKIYDAYQVEVEKAFGRKMISEYGSAEGGIIAFECAHGSMHINMETVIVELVENEIVITNLVSNSFPIIRYKLGDYVRMEQGAQCACGMAHPIMKEVTGRVGDVIYGAKHTYPSLTLYYVFKNLALGKNLILNYQVVQEEIGSVDLYVESQLSDLEYDLLLKEFTKYFQDDLAVVIKTGQTRIDYTTKRKDFISKLRQTG